MRLPILSPVAVDWIRWGGSISRANSRTVCVRMWTLVSGARVPKSQGRNQNNFRGCLGTYVVVVSVVMALWPTLVVAVRGFVGLSACYHCWVRTTLRHTTTSAHSVWQCAGFGSQPLLPYYMFPFRPSINQHHSQAIDTSRIQTGKANDAQNGPSALAKNRTTTIAPSSI